MTEGVCVGDGPPDSNHSPQKSYSSLGRAPQMKASSKLRKGMENKFEWESTGSSTLPARVGTCGKRVFLIFVVMGNTLPSLTDVYKYKGASSSQPGVAIIGREHCSSGQVQFRGWTLYVNERDHLSEALLQLPTSRPLHPLWSWIRTCIAYLSKIGDLKKRLNQQKALI